MSAIQTICNHYRLHDVFLAAHTCTCTSLGLPAVFQLEACTVLACIRSVTVDSTTAESTPQGLSGPHVLVLDAHSVDVRWQEPEQANGLIQRYEIHRQTVVPCVE